MLNSKLGITGKKRKFQLNESEELRNEAHEKSKICKEKDKSIRDKLINKNRFHVGQKVLLYDFELRSFPEKLRSRWIGPYIVAYVYPSGVVKIKSLDYDVTFKVNKQRLKPFLESPNASEQLEKE